MSEIKEVIKLLSQMSQRGKIIDQFLCLIDKRMRKLKFGGEDTDEYKNLQRKFIERWRESQKLQELRKELRLRLPREQSQSFYILAENTAQNSIQPIPDPPPLSARDTYIDRT